MKIGNNSKTYSDDDLLNLAHRYGIMNLARFRVGDIVEA